MPISSSDIEFYLSGGSGNTDPDLSLGGARSTTAITAAGSNNLFDDISGSESASGETTYRCFYVRNEHGSLTLGSAVVFIHTNTQSVDSSIEIGLGTSAVGTGTSESAPSPNVDATAPSGVTFSAPTTAATGLSIGNMATLEHKAIWVKRIILEGAAAHTDDTFVLRVEGTTS
jgi:hypothetical protein